MKALIYPFIVILGFFTLFSCDSHDEDFMYDGRLEATVYKISAAIPALVDSVLVEEGQTVRRGQLLAVQDYRAIHWQINQQLAQLQELQGRYDQLQAQEKQISAQLDFTRSTLRKTERMVQQGAATSQKRDELASRVRVLTAQLAAIKAQFTSLKARESQLKAAIKATKIKQQQAHVTAPIEGVILNRYVNQGEWFNPGQLLFEVCDLRELEAVVYIPLVDLDNIRVGQQVTLRIDGTDTTFSGTIKWIAHQAEFTPKTILTKETRTSLVYAVKIKVPNPQGILKIGMPVMVTLQRS